MAEDYFSFTGKLFDQKGISQKPEALKGIRVLDLSHMIFGPTSPEPRCRECGSALGGPGGGGLLARGLFCSMSCS